MLKLEQSLDGTSEVAYFNWQDGLETESVLESSSLHPHTSMLFPADQADFY